MYCKKVKILTNKKSDSKLKSMFEIYYIFGMEEKI